MKVEENFVVDLTDACKTHEEWLSVVRYGWSELLQEPLLVMEIIVREADRQCQRENERQRENESRTGLPAVGRHVADEARAILKELGLRFTADKRAPDFAGLKGGG